MLAAAEQEPLAWVGRLGMPTSAEEQRWRERFWSWVMAQHDPRWRRSYYSDEAEARAFGLIDIGGEG